MIRLADVLDADPGLNRLAASARAVPDDWQFFTLKGRLVTRFGPDAAHALWTEFLRGFGPVESASGPLLTLRELARAHAPVYRTFASAGRSRFPGAALAGGGRSPACEVAARELFLARLDGATTYGRSNVREIDGGLCTDLQGDEAERYRTDWWFDPMFVDRRDRDVLFHRPADPGIRLAECIDLTGVFSPGWGHWLIEFAPQLLMAELEPQIGPEVPLLVDADLPETHYEMFRFLTGGRRELVKLAFRQAATVERLWAASAPEYFPALRSPGQDFRAELSSINPQALAHLLAHAAKPADTGETTPRRLFLARGGRQVRLANQDEVIAQFRARGFVDVFPERLSFIEQYRLMLNATHVAGAAGSQLLLALLFGRPDLKALVFHQPELRETPSWTAIAEVRGQQALVLVGEVVARDRDHNFNSLFTVSREAVAAALAEWL
jgi:hypothetical protein